MSRLAVLGRRLPKVDAQRARMWLERAARTGFALSIVLLFAGPSWPTGPFAQGTLLSVPLHGRVFSVGVLGLVPAVAAIAWLGARALARGAGLVACPPRHLLLPMLLLSILVVGRLAAAPDASRAAMTIAALLVMWGCLLFVLYERNLSWLLWSLAGVMLVAGGLGIAQFVLQRSTGLPSWLEVPLDPAIRGMSVVDAGGRRWLRAYGTFPHPNLLGGYLALGLLLALGLYAERYRSLGQQPPEWPILALALAVGGMGCLLSFSRSAWLALAVSLGLIVVALKLWRAWRTSHAARRGIWWLAASSLIAAMVVVVLRSLFVARLAGWGQPLESASIRERLIDVELAWGLIRAHPLLGVGPWNYIGALWDTVGAEMGPDYPGFRTVHNVPLLMAAEVGVAGGLLYVAWLLGPLVAVYRRVRRLGRDALSASQAGLAGVFAATLVISMLDVYLYFPVVTFWPSVFFGVLGGAWAHIWARAPRKRGE
jgi:hypothetical protein